MENLSDSAWMKKKVVGDKREMLSQRFYLKGSSGILTKARLFFVLTTQRKEEQFLVFLTCRVG